MTRPVTERIIPLKGISTPKQRDAAIDSFIHDEAKQLRTPAPDATFLEELRAIFETGVVAPRVNRRSGTPPFRVLAIDFALTATLNTEGRGMTGVQQCLCKLADGETVRSNWYRRALQRYFRSAGSLLANEGVSEFARSQPWTLLLPNGVGAQGRVQKRGRWSASVSWMQPFRTQPKRRRELAVAAQFDRFGQSVFNELLSLMSAAEVRRSAILWFYIGPEQPRNDPAGRQDVPPWGASLFVVLHAIRAEKWWVVDSPLFPVFRNSVELVGAKIALAGYVAGQRQSDAERAMRQGIAQTIAHEFKHWSSAPVVLATEIEIASQRTTAIQRARIQNLVRATQLVNAVAVGLHYLLNADQSVRFHQTPDAPRVVRAAARMALELLGASRPNWKVVDELTYDNAAGVVQAWFDARSHDALFDDTRFSALLFLVAEACRNAGRLTIDGDVEVWTEEGSNGTILVHQRGKEQRVPETQHSNSIEYVNWVLGRADAVCSIDPDIPVLSYERIGSVFLVHRATTIRAVAMPK